MQPQISRQASRASQQLSETNGPLEAQDDSVPARGKGSDIQQEIIDKLEGELQAVKASLAKDHAELEELKRCKVLLISLSKFFKFFAETFYVGEHASSEAFQGGT